MSASRCFAILSLWVLSIVILLKALLVNGIINSKPQICHYWKVSDYNVPEISADS